MEKTFLSFGRRPTTQTSTKYKTTSRLSQMIGLQSITKLVSTPKWKLRSETRIKIIRRCAETCTSDWSTQTEVALYAVGPSTLVSLTQTQTWLDWPRRWWILTPSRRATSSNPTSVSPFNLKTSAVHAHPITISMSCAIHADRQCQMRSQSGKASKLLLIPIKSSWNRRLTKPGLKWGNITRQDLSRCLWALETNSKT